jgi:PKD repeat protein
MRTKMIKKIFLSSLSALLLSLFISFNTVAAFSFGDLFEVGGDSGLSFTQYEGALTELSTEGYDSSLVSSTDFREFVLTVVNFALGFLGLAAVIIVIYGGVLYVSSGGEEESTQKGKKAIQYATIGLLIVLGSFAFVNTVIRGAAGEGEGQFGLSGSGGTVSGGFNASAEQIRALALEVYEGYTFLVQSVEEIKGIMYDLQKESIVPEYYPSRQNVITFLGSVETKLENLKGNVGQFSLTASRTTELIREVDLVMDSVNSKRSTDFIRFENSGGSICSPSDDDESCKEALCPRDDAGDPPAWFMLDNFPSFDYDFDFENGFTSTMQSSWEGYWCTSSDEQDDPYVEYPVGLYDAWKPIHNKFNPEAECEPTNDDDDVALCELIEPIAADYAKDLERIFTSIGEIYSNYSNLEPIRTGLASDAYALMTSASAYGFDYSVANDEISIVSGGALDSINNWNLQASIDEVGLQIYNGLEAQADIYTEFKNLLFVETVLSADVVDGAAPLVVTFDTLGTVDPAGGSIKGDSIEWDLAGTKTLMQLLNPSDGETVEANEDVQCESTLLGTGEDEDFIGQTSKRCIFTKPGTYTAAVKIKSNEPTKYAPGVSILTIKVSSPTTKINLNAQGAGAEKTVIEYDNDTGVLITDKNVVTLTVDQAEGGVTFKIPDAATNGVVLYKWDFGNGETIDGDTTGEVSSDYEDPGKYRVILEVTNQLGETDKKIFTLEISSIAAQIDVSDPSGAPVNRSVKFDASNSKSDLGTITNYKWSITPQLEGGIPADILEEINNDYPLIEEGANLEEYTHSFKYPIDYDIELVVTDGTNTASDSVNDYRVTSEPPVAQFDFSIPELTQPGTVYFDASSSYDPDGTDYFDYQWTISPSSYEVEDIVDHDVDSASPIIKFTEVADYEVTLKLVDQLKPTETHEISKTVTIDNILDVNWDDDQETAFRLDDDGEVEIEFELESDNAIAFEADFGDGDESESGDFADGISHVYREAGKFTVNITVFDEEDNANTISRRFFIGSGDAPIAKVRLLIDGNEIQDLSQAVTATKKSIIQFDGGDSINVDGSGRKLKYSWSFGDTDISSKKLATHSYSELSPSDPGYFAVKLTVTDEDDATLTASDEVMIKVINIPPKFSNVQGTPHTREKPFMTPVAVTMRVFGAEDEDGTITKYVWWYFNVDSPNDPIDFAVTEQPSAQLTIGTNGAEDEEITYGFGLELTDSDGLTYSNQDSIDQGNYSDVTVINGANEMPTADFSVSATSVFAGEEINFTSSSSDPDGSITKFYWDFEGDGFFNNEATTESSIKYTYTEKNLDGFDVKLKIIDDKGGEAISAAKKIYVDSIAEPPTAAFKYDVVEDSHGMKIAFTNNSSADEDAGAQILTQSWDFDTASELATADSDGDGVKDNDIDSEATNPQRLYTEAGTYLVKLSLVDNQGNTDEVTATIKVPLANEPIAAFTHEVVDGKMVFTDNSTADPTTDASVVEFQWDFDTASNLVGADSNGDSIKDNDSDSILQNPEYQYQQSGVYSVKLTVTDDQGNEGSVTNDVEYSVIQDIIEDDVPELPEDDGGLDGEPSGGNITAVLSTDPQPDEDGIIYLDGESGTISLNFSKSTGAIATYQIDQNIHYDTDQNGDKNDDVDFQSPLPGTWTANFEKEWGKTVVKLTVFDINGNESTATIEVKFRD